MEVGYNPKDIKAAGELIKKKNPDIVALKKKLRLPTKEHPQTKEVLENENQKYEMMNLIIQLTAQLKEMETEMDKLVQEKQASMEAVPINSIPIASTSPLVDALAPSSTIVPATIATPITTEVLATTPATTSATTSTVPTTHPNDEASKLIKRMHDMSIKTTKINRLKEQLKNL